MTILVTAISGNLGQAIGNLLIKHYPYFRVIGCDSISPMQGIAIFEKLFKVPSAKETTYCSAIKNIISNESINMVIPCNDFELEAISSDSELIAMSLCSEYRTIRTFFDKYLCANHFSNNNLPFCETYLPSKYLENSANIIAKPRRGAGSKYILLNPINPMSLGDDYVIQKFENGIELTVSFYVDKKNKLVGFLPLRKFGFAPNNAYSVYNEKNGEIEIILKDLIETIPISGPCNLQCIINESGIFPFEINCRFSGSVDLQEEFGFRIFRNSIDEHLLGLEAKESKIVENGIGVRNYSSIALLNKCIDEVEIREY